MMRKLGCVFVAVPIRGVLVDGLLGHVVFGVG